MAKNKENTNNEPDSSQEKLPESSTQWVNKAESIIDDTAEKIHKSEFYKETGKVVESATKKIFRQAGKWWGRSERYFKDE